jgi:hypothetical protein
MCEVCEAVEFHSNMMAKFSLLVNIKTRTKEQMNEALEMFRLTGNPDMTFEELEEMSTSELCAIIASHGAMATSAVERDGKPISIIMGEWAGIAYSAEIQAMADRIFGPFGPTAYDHANEN